MTILALLPRTLLSFTLLITLAACNKSSAGSSSSDDANPAILVTFVDDVVVPTYQDLADRAADLDTAVTKLLAEPTEGNFIASRQAWVETRLPWEQSEAFLFGPVDTFGYDPAMDSWPLDHAGLEAAIAAYANIEVDGIDASLKGFHAIEFILFGYEKAKTLASLTSQEKAYLAALTQNLKLVTKRIVTAWQDGANGKPAFALALKNAGTADNDIYPTTQAAIQEMLEGMVGIADEVANNKIAQPFDQQDPNLVESQFSFNSLDDFQNNLRSIRFTWQGSRSGSAASQSLSQRVSSVSPALNQEVESALDAALAALQAIPSPFRQSILEASARPKILAAQDAIRNLQSLLDGKVRDVLFPK